MKPYWLRMRFPKVVVDVVRGSLKAGLWRGGEEDRLEKLRRLNAALSNYYGVPVCFVEVKPTTIGPHYMPGANMIILDKVPLVSFLHEFSHALLQARRKPQQEVFPRAFSLSLFYQAAPRSFEAARMAGRLLFTEDTDEK